MPRKITSKPLPMRPSNLRQHVTRFDLRMNKNRYGLIRRTIKRSTENDVTKEKVMRQMDINNNEATLKLNDVPPFIGHRWKLPKQSLQVTIQKPNLYDKSKSAHFMKLNEECLFEIFNHLTLNDLRNVADVNCDFKLAAQKYFEVIYSRINLDWLIESGAEKFTLIQARRLLQCFGQFISTLFVNSSHLKETDKQEELLEIIAKHCSSVLFWNTKS